ncbi:MAG: ABC transporter permease [Cyclobacteriaceae bacterium]|nr:ABC transporter permease [Cyclobacteriaceae bacterium]
MIGNFFRVALRSFYRRKLFFLINLSGLSVGFASFLTLFFYTSYEEKYDHFQEYKDRLVRVKMIRNNKGVPPRESVYASYGAGSDITEIFPEVERYVRFCPAISLVRYDDRWTKTEKSVYASEDFFKLFSFRLLKGSDSLALTRPHTLVMSESFARKVFGEEDPLGKMVDYKGRVNYEVTGVFADMPPNSHIEFDLVLSFESYKAVMNKAILDEPWRWDGFPTYLLLKPGTSAKALEEKLPRLVEEKVGEYLRQQDAELKIELQPITSIHLNSNYDGEWKKNGDGKLIIYLKNIALGILLLAWINYISLATAKSMERAREVGVRKLVGSYRWQLMVQFFGESFLLNTVALLVAIIVLLIAKPVWPEYIADFNQLAVLSAQQWIIVLVFVLVGGGLMAGLYPALVLSGFNPATVLKGTFAATSRGKGFRKALVTVQFIVSLVLVIWIYVVGQQIKSIRNKPLGFEQSARLVIRESEVYDSLFDRNSSAFRQELTRLNGVENVTYTHMFPGQPGLPWSSNVRKVQAPASESVNLDFHWVDENYDAVLGLRSLAGDGFKETSERNKEIMITASAARALGFAHADEAINERILFFNDTARIVRVVEDFHFYSPRENIKPMAFLFDPSRGFQYIVKTEAGKSREVIQGAGSLFTEIFPGQTFDYQFLDDHYNHQHESDLRFEKALAFFSGLSVFITCLGLVGMSAFTAQVRRKEIGIRKTLGASWPEIVMLLWREYVIIVLLSALVAVPVAWYIADKWLTDFALRINLSPWLFVVPVTALMLITLLTVAFQTIKAALANPVDSIRHE